MVRYLVVGTGPVGTNHLIEISKWRHGAMETAPIPEIELVAVADTRPEIAKAAADRFKAKRFYTNAEEMFAKEKADCAGIFIPANLHCRVAMQALAHGLHVICEKPFCTDVDEGRRTIAAFEKKGRMLAVTFNYRFCEDTRKMKEAIDAGRIGRVLEFRAVQLIGSGRKPPEGSDERRRWDCMFTDEIRGLMYDHGVHSIDLMRWYARSEFKKVTAFGARHQGYKYPDACTAVFQLEGGVKGIYDHGPLPYAERGQGSPRVFFFSVAGTEGSLLWQYAAEPPLSVLTLYTKNGSEVWKYRHGKSRDLMHKQFAECVKQGKLGGYFPSPHDALVVSEWGLKMVESAMANIV
jgi:predicted dehydrogenase